MNRAKTLYRSRLLSFTRIAITSFLFCCLLLSANIVIAESSSPKAQQWQSVGGKIVFSGTHDFTNFWYDSGNGMYWKNDEDKKNAATHTVEEVNKDVMVKKGQITVRGPGFLAKFLRTKKGSVGSKLTFPESGKDFMTASLGGQDLLHDPQGNWDWYDNNIIDFDPSKPHTGRVPADKTLTLDVWAYNNYTHGGVWWRGYAAPKGVEYEYWFFPREGGKIIKVIKYGPNGEEINITTPPVLQHPCEGEYLEELKKRVAKLEPGIYIFCTEGDDIEVDRLGNGDFEDALDLMEKGDFIKLTENAKVITGENSNAVVGFGKRGTVTVKDLTNFSIARYIVSDEGITAHTNMKIGEVNVEVDRRYHEIDFSVSTPTCIAGVRGTEFTMTHEESPMKTTIAVHSGKVEVKPTICSAPARILLAGQRITVDKNCFGKLEVFETDDSNEPGEIDDKRDGDIPFGTTNFNEFSLKGNIYYLQANTSRLPDFGAMSPVGSIYTKELNISNRSFTAGFPGVTNRFEWFGIRYTGTFQIQQGGHYSFRLSSDDGSKLWIDNQLIINNDGVHPNRSQSGTVYLNPGQHHIQVDYFQGPRAMVALQLFMTEPGRTEKIFSPVYSSNQTQ